MYVILGILYESYVHPVTVLSTLFPAVVGGLMTLWLFNSHTVTLLSHRTVPLDGYCEEERDHDCGLRPSSSR